MQVFRIFFLRWIYSIYTNRKTHQVEAETVEFVRTGTHDDVFE